MGTMFGADGLVRVLQRLRDTGSIPRTLLSGATMKKLKPLIDSNVLSIRARGRGGVLQVESMEHLLKFISSEYPSGLERVGTTANSRGSSVLWLRDSKKCSERENIPVLLKGIGDVSLTSADGSNTLKASELTDSFGVASLMLHKSGTDLGYSGNIATVENLEVFTDFNRISTEDVLVVYTGGRASGLLLNWLASDGMSSARITHYGDYDPVGLSEYLRIKEKRSGSTKLFIPDNLEYLVGKYGNIDLLEKSRYLLPGLRNSSDPSIKKVLSILQRKNRALEQEILLEIDLN